MSDITSKPVRIGPTIDNIDPHVLQVMQGISDTQTERDELRKEVAKLKSELTIIYTKLEERDNQIHRTESKLLRAVMRNAQQISIIEQIQKLTETYEHSIHDGNGHAEPDAETVRIGHKYGADNSLTRQ